MKSCASGLPCAGRFLWIIEVSIGANALEELKEAEGKGTIACDPTGANALGGAVGRGIIDDDPGPEAGHGNGIISETAVGVGAIKTAPPAVFGGAATFDC